MLKNNLNTNPTTECFLFEIFIVLTTGVPKCSGFVSGSSSNVYKQQNSCFMCSKLSKNMCH